MSRMNQFRQLISVLGIIQTLADDTYGFLNAQMNPQFVIRVIADG